MRDKIIEVLAAVTETVTNAIDIVLEVIRIALGIFAFVIYIIVVGGCLMASMWYFPRNIFLSVAALFGLCLFMAIVFYIAEKN